MSITAEHFEQGMTYAAYKEQMTRNREGLEANEQTAQLPAEYVAFFTALPQRLNVVVITEDWCTDAMNNLLVLGRLAQESGKLNLRVFLRDQNPDLRDQYLNQGIYRSIPEFIFFDEHFHELGYWIERPAKIGELQGKLVDDLFANDSAFAGVVPGTSPAQMPEAARNRLMQTLMQFHQEQRTFSNSEVARELRELVENGLAAQAA